MLSTFFLKIHLGGKKVKLGNFPDSRMKTQQKRKDKKLENTSKRVQQKSLKEKKKKKKENEVKNYQRNISGKFPKTRRHRGSNQVPCSLNSNRPMLRPIFVKFRTLETEKILDVSRRGRAGHKSDRNQNAIYLLSSSTGDQVTTRQCLK